MAAGQPGGPGRLLRPGAEPARRAARTRRGIHRTRSGRVRVRQPQPQEREPVHRAVAGRDRADHRPGTRPRRDLPGDRVHRVGLPVRGRRPGPAGRRGGRAGGGGRRGFSVVWRHDGDGDTVPGAGAGRDVPVAAPGDAAQPALPQHPRDRPRQRARRARHGGDRLRRVSGRARRLPLRARRHGEYRHRGTRAHGRGHGCGHRRGPRAADRRGSRGGADRRAQAAVPGAARRAADTDRPRCSACARPQGRCTEHAP